AHRVRLEAVVGRGRRRRAGIRERGRAARGGGPVEELELGGDVALRIDGEGGQAARVRRRRVARRGNGGGRRADPRLGLRAQQHRPAARVVGDRQAGLGPAFAVVVVVLVAAPAPAVVVVAVAVRLGNEAVGANP